METKKYVDVERILGDKNPRLLKALPGFVINYIKRVIHQDELNMHLNAMSHLSGSDFANETISRVGAKVEWEGLENIPETGGIVIASNHPLGGLDGVALIIAVHQRRADIKFLVNDILMHLEGLRQFWVPVNKHGKNAGEITKLYDATFASEGATLIFPAGLVSRKGKDDVVRDLEWKKGCLTFSIKHKRNIVPTYIEGFNSNFFYNLSYYRRKLGIKANLEMFYLVDEMFKQKGKTIKIKFGKPISHEVFTKAHSLNHWSAELRHHVYAIGNNQPLVLPTMNV